MDAPANIAADRQLNANNCEREILGIGKRRYDAANVSRAGKSAYRKGRKGRKAKSSLVLRALCGETYILSPSSGLLAKWYSEYASTPNIITDSRLLFARKGIFCPQLIAPSGSQCLASITLITIPASPTIPPAAIRPLE